MGMLLFICLNIGLVLLIPILGMLVKDLIVYIRYFMKYKRQARDPLPVLPDQGDARLLEA